MAEVHIENDVIVGSVGIAAAPERVFRAITDPAQLRAWWGARDSYWIDEWRSDLRVGGAWEARGSNVAGGSFRVHGVYLVVDPPRRLAYTWNPTWVEARETTISYELAPRGAGTLVEVRHLGFAESRAALEDHAGGLPAILRWLRAYCEGPPSA